MAQKINLSLPSADDLFSTQEERDDQKREKLIDIPLAEISAFPNHPFKVVVNDEMLEMAESVRQNGVLVPALVRPKPDGGYEMIAGHRRKMASELAEMPTIPCIARSLTDDQAIIVMVDSNMQREKIEANACKDHIHMLVSIPPKLSVSDFVGYLKGKSSLMIFDQHANLKYKYGNRHFWCRGYYVDTVGRNEKVINEYIKNQLQEDIMADQISLKEYMDPFTGEAVKKNKK